MIDIKALMLQLLEREKGYVVEELEEYGCAMVVTVTPDDTFLAFPQFESDDDKDTAYEEIVSKARSDGATTIITVNSAFTQAVDHPGDLDGYWPGKLNAGNARRCILLTASGPGMKSFGVEFKYQIVDGKALFDPLEDFHEMEVGLLPNWPGDLPTSSN